MSTPLFQLSDRLSAIARNTLYRAANPNDLEEIAAELREHQCAGERESVNAEMLVALREIVDFNADKFSEGPILRRCRAAIARAESAEKAPAQPDAVEMPPLEDPEIDALVAERKPDAVEGLVEALRQIKRHGVGVYHSDESLFSLKQIATDALTAYEKQKEKAHV